MLGAKQTDAAQVSQTQQYERMLKIITSANTQRFIGFIYGKKKVKKKMKTTSHYVSLSCSKEVKLVKVKTGYSKTSSKRFKPTQEHKIQQK